MSPSAISRLLLGLIRGAGSEELRGDLEEWWAEEVTRRRDGHPKRSFEVEVLRSLIQWWRPASIAYRRRLNRTRPRRLGGVNWVGEGGKALGAALRTLGRTPGYALLVVVVMGVGIGATTTVLTIVDRVVLRTMPFPQADRMVVIGNTFPGREWQDGASDIQHLAGFSLANFVDWQTQSRSFERMAAIEHYTVLLPDQGAGPELASSTAVTPHFFQMFDVTPEVGRLFHPDEYRSTATDVVMLSYEAWQRRWGGDPDMVGGTRSTAIAGAQVVGVLPRNFKVPEVLGSEIDDFWFPIKMDSDRYVDRGRRSLTGVATLRAGVEVSGARAEMTALAHRIAEASPEGNVYPDGRRLGAGVNDLRAHTVGVAGAPISLFFAAALVLLLVAGLNTANLVLVRGSSRTREIDIRLALGASRARVAGMLLTETLILAVGGGLLGVFLASVGTDAFRALAPPSVPRMSEVGLDVRILLMAMCVTVGLGLVTGLLPALRLTRLGKPDGIRSHGSRIVGEGRRWPWTVSAQVALSVVLMVGASLLMESLLRVRHFEPGFDPTGALTFRQGLKRPGAPDVPMHQLWDEVLEQVASVGTYPDVAAASNLPFQSPNWAPWVLLPEDEPDSYRTGIAGYVISPTFLDALGIGVLEGRAFGPEDGSDTRSVALVNEAFVETQGGGDNPVGQEIRIRDGDALRPITVVGVVENTVQSRPEEGMLPAVYLPHTQSDWPSIWVFARAAGDPYAGVDVVRSRIAAVNPYVPPQDVATMAETIGKTQVSPRFSAALALAFGLVSLLLSAGGLYGAQSYNVGLRTNEFGVRIALGADQRSVLNMVLAAGLRTAALGIAVGLVAAYASSRLLSSFLFEVGPTDPMAFLLAAAVLLTVACLASLAPAVRATRVDPARALGAD